MSSEDPEANGVADEEDEDEELEEETEDESEEHISEEIMERGRFRTWKRVRAEKGDDDRLRDPSQTRQDHRTADRFSP